MKAANIEKSTIDWGLIRRRYEGERCSIRGLAREHGTTDTAIHRRAKSGGWALFSPNPQPQRGVQRIADKERPWHFETRRDALVTALQRSRIGVETVEASIYCDLPVVMALLWFRAPLAEIAKAVQLTEVQLEEFYGPAIIGFIRDFYVAPPENRPVRRRDKSQRAA